MSNGPPPSRLVSISTLPLCEIGDKVRFLGCVTSYATSNATLTLENTSQLGDRDSDPRQSRVQALVDVNLILQALNQEQTQPGEWVNVVGYINKSDPSSDKRTGRYCVKVQALLLWSAGPLSLQDYERTLSSHVKGLPAGPDPPKEF
ncbi:hypothetical protein MCOR27_006913 [Pyricularia oryzae]|uniref:CST complex subunit Ten1 n=2 Tax=Pyricularia TaxID=48558 RepID=A0ABQ8NCE1_PYRGI|nr:uncharacterized protein MGG_14916 [Pyricularia oryzae 70-15]KAH8845876.1 hypothetical protein MCOR01_003099 [Pyricularia oryzae]KAI6294795.1 hypothetical protein MCOR33_008190 [Pyricularia grisea]EHA47373.1 hypothetical protein MGG_14916 [Pyricularia oryzae 70-15]KAH9432617.1 hypothetical protein MCOR02_007307 [Pyricularia oryzae]KAI6257099.1 hypothetical protein MCOR19_006482 [Pyricularia oryzae]